MYLVINLLPQVEEAKMEKLNTFIKNSCINHFELKDEDIEMPMNPKTGKTFGVAFVKLENET